MMLVNLVSTMSKISEFLMFKDIKMKKETKLLLPKLRTNLNSSNGRSFMLTKLQLIELKVKTKNSALISTDHST